MKALSIGGLIAIVIGVMVAFSVSYEQEESQTRDIESKVLGESDQSQLRPDLTQDITSIQVNLDILAREIHDKTNEVRKQNGLNELSYNDDIAAVAESYSQRMAKLDFLAHNDIITNESSADRGIKNGFPDCGDHSTIQLGKDIDSMQLRFDSNFDSYQTKVDRYNYLYEYYNSFGKDNISVYNEMISLQKELQKTEPKITNEKKVLDDMIDDFNQRVDDNMIFDGFGENIALRGNLISSEIPTSVIGGWMDSPIHRDVLLTESYTQEGIGIAIKPDNSVIVTANYC